MEIHLKGTRMLPKNNVHRSMAYALSTIAKPSNNTRMRRQKGYQNDS